MKQILAVLILITSFAFTIKSPEHDEHAKFKVSGVCEMCKERIESAVKKSQFVKSANWDVKSKMIEVTYDPHMIEVPEIEKLIVASGHDTEKMKADDKVYNSLPSCCHYKREKTKI